MLRCRSRIGQGAACPDRVCLPLLMARQRADGRPGDSHSARKTAAVFSRALSRPGWIAMRFAAAIAAGIMRMISGTGVSHSTAPGRRPGTRAAPRSARKRAAACRQAGQAARASSSATTAPEPAASTGMSALRPGCGSASLAGPIGISGDAAIAAPQAATAPTAAARPTSARPAAVSWRACASWPKPLGCSAGPQFHVRPVECLVAGAELAEQRGAGDDDRVLSRVVTGTTEPRSTMMPTTRSDSRRMCLVSDPAIAPRASLLPP